MDKHIVSLLTQKNRVIIPELGAFIVKQSTPKTFVFNEFLKYNDGMLIEHVMKEENISKEEATTKVDDYVINVNSKLNIGEPYTIEEVGTLKKDRGGKIQFQAEDVSKQTPLYADEPKEKEKPKPPPAQNREEEKQKEDIEKHEETPIELIDEPEKKEDKKQDVTSDKKETPPPVAPPIKNKEAKEDKKETHKKTDQKVIKPVAEKKKMESIYNQDNSKYQPPLEPPKRNSRSAIWITLIALAVVAIGVWLYLNRDFLLGEQEPEENFTETVLGPEEDNIPEEAPTLPDEEATTEPAMEETQQPAETEQQQIQQPVAQADKKYYIVAGCFQSETNADEYAAHLRNQGYNAEKFGKYSGLHAVSFESFANYNEAVRELTKIRNNVEPEAWVLYY